jgi:ADP-ribosylglycohydrolase
MGALAASFMGKPMPTVDAPPNDSKGCGVVMRSAPFGLAAKSRDEAFREARDAGVLTHGHPSGYLSGAYLASLVFDVARGTSLDAAMASADDLLAHERGNEEMRAIVTETRRLASAGPPSVDVIEKLGGGWIGEEALAISLLCTLTAGDGSPASVAAALWRSVAHGGDSDSTGSITGNLLGAMHGIDALPELWLAQLELRDVIERVARDLFASSILDAEPDLESYPAS